MVAASGVGNFRAKGTLIPAIRKFNPRFFMKTNWELVEEWIWSGFDGCDEWDWILNREFGAPRETLTIDHDDKEITYRGKRYETEFSGDRCLLRSLDDIFMNHAAFCLVLRKI
jgi:hypothetical protein